MKNLSIMVQKNYKLILNSVFHVTYGYSVFIKEWVYITNVWGNKKFVPFFLKHFFAYWSINFYQKYAQKTIQPCIFYNSNIGWNYCCLYENDWKIHDGKLAFHGIILLLETVLKYNIVNRH